MTGSIRFQAITEPKYSFEIIYMDKLVEMTITIFLWA